MVLGINEELPRDRQTFSLKSLALQAKRSVATTYFCHCDPKPARGNMLINKHGCVPTKLY